MLFGFVDLEIFRIFSFRSCFLNLCTVDILGLISLCCRVEADDRGAVLCIADCLVATQPPPSGCQQHSPSQRSSGRRGSYQNRPWLRTTVFYIENILAKQFYLRVKITKTPYGLNTNVSFQLLIRYSKFEPNQTYYNTYNVGGGLSRYIPCPKTYS